MKPAIRPFVSYAREDELFVLDLRRSLEEEGFQPWIDTQEVSPGDRLSQTILGALLESDVFVPILSSAYLVSPWCSEEYEAAARHNKQIVPVMLERLASAQLHQLAGIADILWIDAIGAVPATAVAQLSGRLREDPARRRSHARLVAAAQRWHDGGEQAGYLLFGVDLDEGLLYVNDTAARGPPAGVLLRRFVEASGRRRREEQAEYRSLYAEAQRERTAALQLLATSYRERGRRELLDGEHVRASLFLIESLRLREDDECRTLLGFSLPPLQRRRSVLAGHRDYVLALDVRSDGNVLSAGNDGLVLLQALDGGRAPLRHEYPPKSVRDCWFCGDGRVAVWLADGRIDVLNSERLELIAAIKTAATGASAAMSPDGSLLAVVSADSDGALILCDLTRGRIERTLTGPAFAASRVQWLTDDAVVLLAGDVVRVASVTELRELVTLALPPDRIARLTRHTEAHPEGVALAIHPESRTIAASFTWTKVGLPFVAMWTLDDLTRPARIAAKTTGFMEHLAFAADGSRLLTGGIDHAAVVWDVETGQPITTFLEHGAPIGAVALATDGHGLLAISADGDGKMLLWEPDGGRVRARFEGHFEGIRHVHMSERVVVTAGADGLVISWSGERHDIWSVGGEPDHTPSAGIDAHGRILLASGDAGEIHAWDVIRRAKLATFSGHAQVPDAVAVGPRVIAGGREGEVSMWRWEDCGTPLVCETAHRTTVKRVLMVPNGLYFLTSSLDDSTILWDLESGRRLAEQPYGGLAVAVHPSLPWAAVADQRGDIHLLGLPEFHEERVLRGHHGAVFELQFLPEGLRLLSTCEDETARIWTLQLEDRKIIGETCTVLPHGGEVVAADVSADGKYIATAASDGSARIWNPAGALLASLDNHEFLWQVRLHPRRPLALTVDMKVGKARLWHAESGNLVREFVCPGGLIVCAEFLPEGDRALLTVSPGVIIMPGLRDASRRTRGRGGSGVVVWEVPFEPRDADALENITRGQPFELKGGKLLRAVVPSKSNSTEGPPPSRKGGGR